MWMCPVCKNQYEDEKYICPTCAFDVRKDCTNLVSLVPLGALELSRLEKMWRPLKAESGLKPESGLKSKLKSESDLKIETAHESMHEPKVSDTSSLWEQASFDAAAFENTGFKDSGIENSASKDSGFRKTSEFSESSEQHHFAVPFEIQEDIWFEMPVQRVLWYDFAEKIPRIDWGYLNQYPEQFFKAYGECESTYMSEYTAKGLKGILNNAEITENQMVSGGERLYNDLMFMYCSNISDIKIFSEVKKRFSKKYNDGYDRYRNVVFGIFLWRNASLVRQANAFKAFDIFSTLSAQGYALATAWLSECYRTGKGAKQDIEQAKKLWVTCRLELRKLAENHNAEAQYMLGKHEMILQRKSEARRWMVQAWANRCVPAGETLGDLYIESANSKKDRVIAFAFYKMVSWQNMTSTMKRLGSCYDYGWGTSHDVSMAEKYYYKALKNKEPEVIYAYGRLLYEHYPDSYEDAIEYLLVAKAHGFHKAENFLKEAGLLNLNRKVNEEKLDWGTRREYNKFH